MNKMNMKIMKMKLKLNAKVKEIIADESGEMGIKQIALTVAVIVLIGFVVTLLRGELLKKWIEELWTKFMGLIDSSIK